VCVCESRVNISFTSILCVQRDCKLNIEILTEINVVIYSYSVHFANVRNALENEISYVVK
jgi:hypothetical protein